LNFKEPNAVLFPLLGCRSRTSRPKRFEEFIHLCPCQIYKVRAVRGGIEIVYHMITHSLWSSGWRLLASRIKPARRQKQSDAELGLLPSTRCGPHCAQYHQGNEPPIPRTRIGAAQSPEVEVEAGIRLPAGRTRRDEGTASHEQSNCTAQQRPRLRTLWPKWLVRGLSGERRPVSMIVRSTTRLQSETEYIDARKPLATHASTLHWVKFRRGRRGRSFLDGLLCRSDAGYAKLETLRPPSIKARAVSNRWAAFAARLEGDLALNKAAAPSPRHRPSAGSRKPHRFVAWSRVLPRAKGGGAVCVGKPRG
jgi:hypothetical protein